MLRLRSYLMNKSVLIDGFNCFIINYLVVTFWATMCVKKIVYPMHTK